MPEVSVKCALLFRTYALKSLIRPIIRRLIVPFSVYQSQKKNFLFPDERTINQNIRRKLSSQHWRDYYQEKQ